MQKFFGIVPQKISLEIIKYNKNIQKRLNININKYKEYSELYSSIEIEIIPVKNNYGKIINIKEENKKYFHIYFNDNKQKEIEKIYFFKNDNVSKINIIIDYQIISFNKLFYLCQNIESINFKKFYRININNTSFMFRGCSSLKELNLSNFKTNNVTDMSYMFGYCSSLRELNLSNFNTNKVTNMHGMFSKCLNVLKLHIKNNYKNFKKEAFL